MGASKKLAETAHGLRYAREYWAGDSRDGQLVNGDGYHYYEMTSDGVIREAYEVYELDDGTEVVTPYPEMKSVDWMKDLGFDDWEALDMISEAEFERIRVTAQARK